MEAQGKQTFYCPMCGQKLSFLGGTMIKMVGRLSSPMFSCRTMVYVPAELGRHGAIVGEGIRIQDGAKVELECINGSCKHNFTTAYNDELAEISMRDDSANEFRVVFNKVWGKNSTFVLDMESKKLVQSFGEAQNSIFDSPADRFTNFFGE